MTTQEIFAQQSGTLFRRPLTSVFFLLLGAGICSCALLTAEAQIVVYSNYTAGSPGGSSGEENFIVPTGGQALGSPFVPSSTVNLSSVTVNLNEGFDSNPDNYVFRVYDSAGTTPGTTVLGNLAVTEASTGAADYTFNAVGTTTLNSGTTYWLVLQPVNNSGTYQLFWETGTSHSTDGRAVGTVNSAGAITGWSAGPGLQPFSMIIQGTPVPEPSAYAAVFGGIALVVAAIKRWKRN